MALTKADLIQTIENVQAACIALATGQGQYEDYKEARSCLLSQTLIRNKIPDWLIRCRYGGQFWELMKETSGTYQGPIQFIWKEFIRNCLLQLWG